MDPQQADLRILGEDLAFPEGPILLPDGDLAVCEIANGTIRRISACGNSSSAIVNVGGGPNGLAIGPDGCIYICNNGGFTWVTHNGRLAPASVLLPEDYSGGRIERLNINTGKVDILYSGTAEGSLNGPNDLVFSALAA